MPGEEQTLTNAAPIRLTRRKTVGCYATDAQGRSWATFWYAGGCRCSRCGATIIRGWYCADGEYVCGAHVEMVDPT